MELVDTDFEDESEVEDLSPRLSLISTKGRSEETISSFDELHTPNLDSNGLFKFNFDFAKSKSVEGPHDPHLFRASMGSLSIVTEPDTIEDYYLNMSPTMPTTYDYYECQKPMMECSSKPRIRHSFYLSTNPRDSLNLGDIVWWSPRQVARWMFKVGFELSIAQKFEKNDISGSILLTIKFEDLIELDIPSFSIRKKVWNEVEYLRRNISKLIKKSVSTDKNVSSTSEELLKSSERCKCNWLEEGQGNSIEQLVHSQYKCAMEECSKLQKQRPFINNFYQQLNSESIVKPLLAGICVMKKPISSSDTSEFLTSAIRPLSILDGIQKTKNKQTTSHLEEANLRLVSYRDPQEHVKQFIESQNVCTQSSKWCSNQETKHEKYLAQPHELESLGPNVDKPRLPSQVRSPADKFSPHQMERAAAIRPELQNVKRPTVSANRVGTSLSETDISLTVIRPELGPFVRKVCQFVHKNFTKSSSYISHFYHAPLIKPLSPIDEEKVVGSVRITNDHVTKTGWMKKRKTKMLRFDWHNYYFSLKGTQLVMYKHDCLLEAIDSIDIDDYAVLCCSSFATSPKLHAALKAMAISREKDKGDAATFVFQLVPAPAEKGNGRISRRKIKAHFFAVRSQDERSNWMREMMLAKAMNQKNRGYEINVNGIVT